MYTFRTDYAKGIAILDAQCNSAPIPQNESIVYKQAWETGACQMAKNCNRSTCLPQFVPHLTV